ncbi:hypothetical protein ACFT30_08445 [Microbacterium ureisolvens]|uniref:hypothetical protein n=1 Tax=Microbacterium ureisolvens TaxID=2781186 RepID=UPI003627C697
MKQGRPPLSIGAHGKIATERIDGGRFRASARLRTWDDEVHRVTATDNTAARAQALLKRRMSELLRKSELSVWRTITADDPFHELVICGLDDLWSFSDTNAATCARCELVVGTQLEPAFGHLSIGEITRERIEDHLAILRVESEEAAASSYEVLDLLLDFAVGEGAIASNPMEAPARDQAPPCLGDLDGYRKRLRGRVERRREEGRHQAAIVR